jgi:hypothetical protein
MEQKFIHEVMSKPSGEMMTMLHGLRDGRMAAIRKNGLFEPRVMVHRVKQHGIKIDDDRATWYAGLMSQDVALATFINMSIVLEKEGLGNVPAFIFNADFFRLLQRVDISEITWGDLPDRFLGVIRFPYPVEDEDGDLVSEIMIGILPTSEYTALCGVRAVASANDGDRVVLAAWLTHDEKIGMFQQFSMADSSLKVVDYWENSVESLDQLLEKMSGKRIDGSSKGVASLLSNIALRCLIYITSGTPDLREFRNELRYQSLKTKRLVKSHQSLSEVLIYRVGWGWLKAADYTAEAWDVRPFYRRTPSGKRVLVSPHVRHRRQELLRSESDEQATLDFQ